MKLVIKTNHTSGISEVIATARSIRQALELVEEEIINAREKCQGSTPEEIVKTLVVNNKQTYSESWFSDKPYGFILQTYPKDWLRFTCYYRTRSVGFFYNSHVDVNIFTLQIVNVKHDLLINDVVDNRSEYFEGESIKKIISILTSRWEEHLRSSNDLTRDVRLEFMLNKLNEFSDACEEYLDDVPVIKNKKDYDDLKISEFTNEVKEWICTKRSYLVELQDDFINKGQCPPIEGSLLE